MTEYYCAIGKDYSISIQVDRTEYNNNKVKNFCVKIKMKCKYLGLEVSCSPCSMLKCPVKCL